MGWSQVSVKDVVCSTLDWYAGRCISDVIQRYYDMVHILLSDWLSLSNKQMYTTAVLVSANQAGVSSGWARR